MTSPRLVRFLARQRILSRLPGIPESVTQRESYLPNYSDHVLRVRHEGLQKFQQAMGAIASAGPDVIDLSFGVPELSGTRPSPGRGPSAGYPPVHGIGALREAISDSIERIFSADEIIVTNGASGALSLVIEALVNPGDKVVLFDPSFLMYSHLVASAGGKIHWLRTALSNGSYQIEESELEAALRGAKLLVLNSPGNPDGGCIDAALAARISKLAQKHATLLLLDEVYDRFHFGEVSPSMAKDPALRPQCIVINSFSKSFGLPGERVGYLCAHGPWLEPMKMLQGIKIPFAAESAQLTALACLEGKNESFDESLERFRRNRDRITHWLCHRQIEAPVPGGAIYYWIPTEPWGCQGEELMLRLLKRGLAVMPGEFFGPSGVRFVRLSFGTSEEKLTDALKILDESIS